MLTTIDIPEALRNQKINLGMTWLGVIKQGLSSGSERKRINELEEECKDYKQRIGRLQDLLEKYVKLSKEKEVI